MTIYNITFMMERSLAEDFLHWFRSEALLCLDDGAGANPRMTVVSEVPGDPDFNDQALSYAFQMEFEDIDKAKRWADRTLMPQLHRYTELFGRERAVVFTTILEAVSL